jgi:hypothetical protein
VQHKEPPVNISTLRMQQVDVKKQFSTNPTAIKKKPSEKALIEMHETGETVKNKKNVTLKINEDQI